MGFLTPLYNGRMENLELVRLLIPDIDTSNQIFSDAQIEGYLQLANDNVKRAAAYAIRAVANDEALLFKVIKTDDQSVNAASVARALLATAQQYTNEADKEDDENSESYFEIIDYCPTNTPPELYARGGWIRGSWTIF